MEKNVNTEPDVGNEFLSLFDDVDERPLEVKTLTRGLGFKDRVSEGVYTVEVEPGATSDGGTLDIGREDLGDGTLNIGSEGGLRIEASDSVQPILFHSGHDGLVKKMAKKSGESVLGAFIDSLLILSLTIFTSAILTEFTRMNFDFEKLIAFNLNELSKLGVVFIAYFLSYKVFTRVFFGKTLGEWSSRHQLGLLQQQHKIQYPAQVVIRETFCLSTGIFLLPILSLFVRKDLGYYFSGLQTYVEQKK